MTSKSIEDDHKDMINRLLTASKLECIRSLSVSEESSYEVRDEGIEAEHEYEFIPEEGHVEKEIRPPEEAMPEEISCIFPTPSLRKLLPERIRKIQEKNQIHVLPEEFRTDIDPLLIPKIAITPPGKYIDILAEMVGCEMYKSSLAEYWFLDTLANLLRRAQCENMHRATQAVLIQWFCEWMKEIQYFDAADRPRMLKRFRKIMLQAAHVIGEESKLPTPHDAQVSYKPIAEEIATSAITSTNPNEKVPTPEEQKVHFEGTAYECSLQDMIQIMHYLFDLFSSDFQYNLMRSIFTTPPDYSQVDTPHQIQIPKRLYAVVKGKKKETKSPKKEKKPPPKGAKGPKDVETEEFLALMALKEREERELEERAEIEREEWLKKSSILPLSLAADDALFDKYWPPPPPVSPSMVVVGSPTDSKKKGGKGGKGKK